MSQNRNKLLDLLIGNLSNVVVHKVLEESAKEEILRNHYDKESLISFNIAKRYREKINPVQRELPDKDIEYIKKEVLKKAYQELNRRISKGYEGLDLSLVEGILEDLLQDLKVKG